MESLTATGPFLIILNMGDDTGSTHKRGIVLRGRWLFRLKDTIDRRFMKRFQLSGELEKDNDVPAQ